MTANQTPDYRPGFVTQRDGSSLANANCRMASIAMGVDLESHGAKRSTGAKMRSYTDDQSGGTDSGDAKQSWDRGYDETLTVRDGSTFDDALADLRAWRAVHLDVYHATVGGPCLSGSGSYGHTMIVLPDFNSSGWLVGDPWCTNGYHRVTESKLRAGAERWGSEVYGRAVQEPDYPTGGDPRDPRVLAIVSRIVKRLMSAAYPEGPTMELRHPETGGGSILYTVTHPLESGGKAEMIQYSPRRWLLAGGTDFYDGPDGTRIGSLSSDQKVEVTTLGGQLTASGSVDWDWLPVLIESSLPSGSRAWKVLWIEHPGGSPLEPGPDWSNVALEALNDYKLTNDGGGSDPGPDELAVRQDEWDHAAAALIGPRPVG